MSDIKNNILSFVGKDNFLDEFYELYCQYKQDSDNTAFFIQTIISLHNENLLNIVNEFNKLKNNGNTAKVDFFLCRHVFGKILPFINADIKDVLNCVKHLTLEAGNDFAANELIAPFEAFCKTNINHCEELLKIGVNNIDENFDCITIAIITGSSLQLEIYTEKAIALCDHKSDFVQKRALFSLGQINYQSNNELINNAFNIIKSKTTSCNKDFYPYILRTILSLYNQKNDLEEQIIHLFSIILKNEDDLLIHSVSEILLHEKKNLSENIFNTLLNVLTKVNPNNIKTLNYIDYILYDLLKNDIKENVFVFLEKLLIKNNNLSICTFDYFIRELTNNKQNVLNTLITRWFLSKRAILGKAINEIIRANTNNKLVLSLDDNQLKNLPEGVCLFLARKACGWLFHQVISAVSYIVSLIDFSTDKELIDISSLLFHPLLISYPETIKNYFEDLLQQEISEKTAKIINALLTQEELFFKKLNDYGFISELRPSLSQRAQYNQYHSKLMNEAYKIANEKSIINDLATCKTLLYGNSSIHYIYHDFNDPNSTNKTRDVVSLCPFSHSFAYPSLALLNPHNLDFMLRRFCTEGCYEINN